MLKEREEQRILVVGCGERNGYPYQYRLVSYQIASLRTFFLAIFELIAYLVDKLSIHEAKSRSIGHDVSYIADVRVGGHPTVTASNTSFLSSPLHASTLHQKLCAHPNPHSIPGEANEAKNVTVVPLRSKNSIHRSPHKSPPILPLLRLKHISGILPSRCLRNHRHLLRNFRIQGARESRAFRKEKSRTSEIPAAEHDLLDGELARWEVVDTPHLVSQPCQSVPSWSEYVGAVQLWAIVCVDIRGEGVRLDVGWKRDIMQWVVFVVAGPRAKDTICSRDPSAAE